MNTLQIGLIIALISFFTGGFLGYKVELSRAIKAESALTRLQETAYLAQKHYEREQELLKGQVAQAQEQGKKDLEISAKNLETFKEQQTKNLSKKDLEIANLRRLVSGRETELGKLRVDLALATNEAEKAKIQAEIEAQEKALELAKLRQTGLECLTIPIPEEYVSNLNAL